MPVSAEPSLQTGTEGKYLSEGEPALPFWQVNPVRSAWTVLLISFAIFLILVISGPLAFQYFVRYASVAERVNLSPTLGTILLYPPRVDEPIAITSLRDDVAEGSRIQTMGNTTQGTLTLLDPESETDTLGTVHLYPSTVLDVLRIRRPRFSASPEPYLVRLYVPEGRIRLLTRSGGSRPLQVEVETPHGRTTLSEGSYNFVVSDDRTELAVRQGEASVFSQTGTEQRVGAGLRAVLTENETPIEPLPAQRDLIDNGDFNRPLLDTWEVYTQAEQNVVPGSVEIIDLDGRRVARFVRQGEEYIHTEVGISQQINQDVDVYDSLRLRLDLRLIRQSLPGAGYLSTEFPLRVEIDYTDIYGKDLHWGWGFYYMEPRPEWPLTGGEKISPYVWWPYESPDLMEELEQTPPAHINGVRIYASGWNYEAMIGEISLLAE